MSELDIVALSLLVLAGLASATYAKAEGTSSVVAALVGAGVALIIYLLTVPR